MDNEHAHAIVARDQRIDLLQVSAEARNIRDLSLVLAASAPVALAVGILIGRDITGIIGLVYAFATGIAGTMFALYGHLRRRAALRALAIADAEQLPPARLLE